MKTFQIRESLGASALGLALAVATSGCGSDVPVGGLTNPNAGSMVDRDKPAARTDMKVSDQNATQKEPIAEAASTSPASPGTSAGTGGPGGGQPGATTSDVRQGSPEAATPAPASPASKENSGDASGGTKPSEPIKEGDANEFPMK